MSRPRMMLSAALLLVTSGAHAQTTNDFATGNMHFDAKDMDTNDDHMITRDEMLKYGEKMWEMMAKGKDTIPISVATADFATGGVNFKAKAIDTDHDGSISKEEFLAYTGRKFDALKNADGMVSITDMAQAFARGNPHPAARTNASKDTSSPTK